MGLACIWVMTPNTGRTSLSAMVGRTLVLGAMLLTVSRMNLIAQQPVELSRQPRSPSTSPRSDRAIPTAGTSAGGAFLAFGL